MDINGRIARQVLLFSLLGLILPLVLFPERLGTGLAKASLMNAMYELVFYGVVIFLFHRRTSLLQLVQASGLCLIYRFVLGAVFGLLVVVMYPMNPSVALALGMSSYLPAILLHIAATPFILKPVIDRLMRPQPSRKSVASEPTKSQRVVTQPVYPTAQQRRQSYKAPSKADKRHSDTSRISTTGAAPSEGSGFERAVRYIAEDGSVLVAAVVDNEGLLLSGFSRGDVEAEDWGPFALPLIEKSMSVTQRIVTDVPEKIECTFRDNKVVVAREDAFCLMVVSERAMDDVLHIRINQALDIIRKYVAERYSTKLIANAERIYV